MDVRNCKQCDRIYRYDGFNICSRCRNTNEDEFSTVIEYLYENKHSNIKETSEATGVSIEKITEFIRQGKIETRNFVNMKVQCIQCERTVTKGKICDKCKEEMKTTLKEKVELPQDSGKISIMGRNIRK